MLCVDFSQLSLTVRLAWAFFCCERSRLLPWFFTLRWRSAAVPRLDQPYCTCSPEWWEYSYFSVCGPLSREPLWRSLRYGAPSCIPPILGPVSSQGLSVLPWPSWDPGPGRLTLTCLDGSASSFRTERVNPHPHFECVPSPKRGPTLPRHTGTGDRHAPEHRSASSGIPRELLSITSCPESQLRLCLTPAYLLLPNSTTKAMPSEEDKVRLIHEYRTVPLDRMFDELCRRSGYRCASDVRFGQKPCGFSAPGGLALSILA